MLISDAKRLYGYIDEPIEGDKNNLRSDFNGIAGRVYEKLNFYFDSELATAMYPEIYAKLCETLKDEILKKTREGIFFIMIGATADYAVERAISSIDVFSEGCILSKGTFNTIQKDIVRYSLPSMITGTGTADSYNTVQNGDIICEKYKISRVRYSLERLKAVVEVQKCRNIAKKNRKEKRLIVK